MKKLIQEEEVQKVLGLQKWGAFGKFIAKKMMQITKIDEANTIYQNLQHLPSDQFLEELPAQFGAHVEIDSHELNRIPKNGAFITISNHPLGGLDGILLMHYMAKVRPEFKILANFLLNHIVNLRPYLLPVNPFEAHKDKKSSIEGIKKALKTLNDGHPIGIFPAGEVSMMEDDKSIQDREWQLAAIRLIQKANVPVIPIYFHARNSNLFYKIARINDTLRTAMLPRELVNKHNSEIKIRIGRPIMPKEIAEYKDLTELSSFLRNKTYRLAKTLKEEEKRFRLVRKFLAKRNNIFSKPIEPEKIIDEQPIDELIMEIDALRMNGKQLFDSGNYEVFFSSSQHIPSLLTEIGRLREKTFRAAGEGTNQEIDLDKYDTYYHHLILWNNQDKKMVGAYRMGLGKEIFKKHGIKGFYTHELFDFDEEIHFLFSHAIEMGRAFISEEYQQKPMPLYLLWKGIVYVTLKYPEYRILMGGVSISNKFSNFSKSVMIDFMKSHFYDGSVAQYIHPKNSFKVQLSREDREQILEGIEADINKFDKLIDEIEPGDLRFPVLLKKYIKQNARIVSFNVDPKFNDAIDGLMYIRIQELPEETVNPIIEEIEKKAREEV